MEGRLEEKGTDLLIPQHSIILVTMTRTEEFLHIKQTVSQNMKHGFKIYLMVITLQIHQIILLTNFLKKFHGQQMCLTCIYFRHIPGGINGIN